MGGTSKKRDMQFKQKFKLHAQSSEVVDVVVSLQQHSNFPKHEKGCSYFQGTPSGATLQLFHIQRDNHYFAGEGKLCVKMGRKFLCAYEFQKANSQKKSVHNLLINLARI